MNWNSGKMESCGLGKEAWLYQGRRKASCQKEHFSTQDCVTGFEPSVVP